MDQYQQAVMDVLDDLGVTVFIKYVGLQEPPWSVGQKVGAYKVTIRRKRNNRAKYYTYTFYDSIRSTELGTTPNEYDVLSVLEWYEPEADIDDFVQQFGGLDAFGESVKEAMRVHKAVLDQHKALKRLFSESEMERLAEVAQ